MAIPSASNPVVGDLIANNIQVGGVKILVGAGVPSASAPKGSLYINTSASTSATRLYINKDGTTGWAAFTAAS